MQDTYPQYKDFIEKFPTTGMPGLVPELILVVYELKERIKKLESDLKANKERV